MNRLRLEAGDFSEALRRPACRRAQQHPHALRAQDREDRPHDRGLADAGAARDDEGLRRDGQAHGFALPVGEVELEFPLDPLDRFRGVDGGPRRRALRERANRSRQLLLHRVQPRQEDAVAPPGGVRDDGALVEFGRERGCDNVARHIEQLRGRLDQLLARQAALAFVHSLHEGVGDAGPGADGGGLLDAEPEGEGVGGDEADAADVARQAVGVLRDDGDRVGAVRLVDPRGARRADAVGVEEDHDVADDLLSGPCLHDLSGPAGADAGNLAQPARLGVDHLEHEVAERLDEFAREHRPDAPDEAGSQVPLDALEAARRRGVHGRGAELQAVGKVVQPLAHRADLFAGRDRRRVPHHRLEIAAAGHPEADHAETGVRVVKRDALDGTADGGRVGAARLRRGGPSVLRAERQAAASWQAAPLSHRRPSMGE